MSAPFDAVKAKEAFRLNSDLSRYLGYALVEIERLRGEVGKTANTGGKLLREAQDEIAALRAGLWECVKWTGADTSGGIPTWPDIVDYAIREVRRLREESDAEGDRMDSEIERLTTRLASWERGARPPDEFFVKLSDSTELKEAKREIKRLTQALAEGEFRAVHWTGEIAALRADVDFFKEEIETLKDARERKDKALEAAAELFDWTDRNADWNGFKDKYTRARDAARSAASLDGKEEK
jgi:PAS domain-containing protein